MSQCLKSASKFLKFLPVRCSVAAYDNALTAYNPQWWAWESIRILRAKMPIATRVHRDFSTMVANAGDTVNTRKPADFTAYRKNPTDDVTIQDASATNVAVVLNQHVHVSILLRDSEISKSFKDLVTEFLEPAVNAMAKHVDQVCLGQYAQFMANNAGRLGTISGTTGKGYIIDAGTVLDTNLAPSDNRSIFWSSHSHGEIQKNDIFMQAYSVGDQGQALRTGELNEKFNFHHYLSQNMASFSYVAPITGAVNLAAGYDTGTTTMTVDGLSAAITANTYFTVAGDDTPQRVVSTTGGSTPTAVVFTPGLKRPVVNDAVIKFYTPVAVNFASAYASGYTKEITYTGTPVLKVGQAVSFGVDPTGPVYVVTATPSSTTFRVERPLDAAVADAAKINMAPAGDYNFALHRNAFTLMIRPLALPMAPTGVSGFVANDAESGTTMRAVMTYDGTKQGHLITLDFLMGVKVLDLNLGCVLLG